MEWCKNTMNSISICLCNSCDNGSDETAASAVDPCLQNAIITELEDSGERLLHKERNAPNTAVEMKEFPESSHSKHELKLAALECVPSWSSMKLDELIVRRIPEGLSNELFEIRCTKQVHPQRIMLRAYGKVNLGLLERGEELELFLRLGKLGVAAKCYGSCSIGRAEEYLVGKTIRYSQLRDSGMLVRIARELATFHKKCTKSLGDLCTGEPACRTRMIQFVSTLASVLSDRLLEKLLLGSSVTSVEELETDAMLIEGINLLDHVIPQTVDSNNPLLKLSFCHNDLHGGNILATDTTIQLVDFEYSTFNFTAFDVGHLFSEMTVSYSVDKEPWFEQTCDIVELIGDEYLKPFSISYLTSYYEAEPSKEQVEEFMKTSCKFMLVAQLYTGFWGILSAVQGSAGHKFDYLAYAKNRFTAYQKYKKFLSTHGGLSGLQL